VSTEKGKPFSLVNRLRGISGDGRGPSPTVSQTGVPLLNAAFRKPSTAATACDQPRSRSMTAEGISAMDLGHLFFPQGA
jgi:hypothetical protein